MLIHFSARDKLKKTSQPDKVSVPLLSGLISFQFLQLTMPPNMTHELLTHLPWLELAERSWVPGNLYE